MDAARVGAWTGAGRHGIFSVTRNDHAPVADGEPGPLTTRLKRLYWQRHDEGWQSTPIDYGLED